MQLKRFKQPAMRRKSVHLIFLFALVPTLLFAFQNCESTGLGGFGVFANNAKQESTGGNGEPYDGKPLWARLVPGLTCSNQNIAIGSLELHATFATVISNENSCSGAAKEIPLNDLEYSTFSEKYIGYQDGVYTRLPSVSDSIKRGVFTEAWCRALTPDRTKSKYEFAVEYEEQTQLSRLWVYDAGTLNPTPQVISREINIDRVFYQNADRALRINLTQKTPGSYKVPGVYAAEIDGVETQINVECLMGGQFDPVAPKFEFNAPANQTLIDGEALMPVVPVVNKAITKFTLDKNLPNGLSFNSETGVIAGKPQGVQARQDFQLSAVFGFGRVTRQISIAVGKSVHVSNAAGLRQAIENANAEAPLPVVITADKPQIDLDANHLTVTGDILLVGALNERTVIDAHKLSKHFELKPKAFLELRHLKLMNGFNSTDHSGGSITATDATLLIHDTAFENNANGESGYAGAVVSSNGKIEIIDSQFTGNSTSLNGGPGGGGALHISGTETLIRNSKFIGNLGRNGGAITVYSAGRSVFRVEGSTFENNVGMAGGAIYLMSAPISIDRSHFINNMAYFDGGALSLVATERAWVSNSLFDGNAGNGFGSSAIYWQGNSWGGYRAQFAALYLTDSEFLNHHATFRGGVVLNMLGEIVIRGLKMHGNSSQTNCKSIGNSDSAFTSLGGNSSDDGSCPP